MSKPYIPTFEIIIRRSFDGKVEGERTWKLSAAGSYVDKLEDVITFVADTAMDAYGMRTAAASTPETRSEVQAVCDRAAHLADVPTPLETEVKP